MLDAKVGELERLFSPLLQQASVPILYAKGIDRGVAVRPEVFSSPPLHFRSRCRFQVMWDDATVTAESIGTSPRETATPGRRLSYRMWNKGEPTVSINEFPMALRVIETLMPAVLREADVDGDDLISFAEFKAIVLSARGTSSKWSKAGALALAIKRYNAVLDASDELLEPLQHAVRVGSEQNLKGQAWWHPHSGSRGGDSTRSDVDVHG